MNAISKCCTDRCGWGSWTPGNIRSTAPCTSRCAAGWGWRKPESPWKCRTVGRVEIQNQDFHPSHRPWKSPPRFPHSHRLDDSLIINPERKTLLRKVLPMSSDRSVTYVPGWTNCEPKVQSTAWEEITRRGVLMILDAPVASGVLRVF